MHFTFPQINSDWWAPLYLSVTENACNDNV